MERTDQSTDVPRVVPPTLIQYRQLLPTIFDYFGTALVMFFMSIISVLVGALAIIVLGTVLAIATIAAGISGVSLGILIPLGVGILAAVTWWHVFASQMAMVRGVLLQHSAGEYLTHLKFVYAHWWRILLLVAMVQLLIAAGFVLFVIPGVIASIYLGFALFSFMVETPRIRMALARSMVLVHGRFWALLGRYAYLIFVAGLVLITILMVSFAFRPLILLVPFIFIIAALGSLVLFRSVQRLLPLQAEHPTILTKEQTWLFAVLALCGLVVLVTMSVLFDNPKPTTKNTSNDLVISLQNAEVSGALIPLRTELEGLIEKTKIQHDATGDYSGVCNENAKAAGLVNRLRALSADGKVDCMASEYAYAFEVVLKTGDFLCLDSNGIIAISYTPRVAPDQCNIPLP